MVKLGKWLSCAIPTGAEVKKADETVYIAAASPFALDSSQASRGRNIPVNEADTCELRTQSLSMKGSLRADAHSEADHLRQSADLRAVAPSPAEPGNKRAVRKSSDIYIPLFNSFPQAVLLLSAKDFSLIHQNPASLAYHGDLLSSGSLESQGNTNVLQKLFSECPAQLAEALEAMEQGRPWTKEIEMPTILGSNEEVDGIQNLSDSIVEGQALSQSSNIVNPSYLKQASRLDGIVEGQSLSQSSNIINPNYVMEASRNALLTANFSSGSNNDSMSPAFKISSRVMSFLPNETLFRQTVAGLDDVNSGSHRSLNSTKFLISTSSASHLHEDMFNCTPLPEEPCSPAPPTAWHQVILIPMVLREGQKVLFLSHNDVTPKANLMRETLNLTDSFCQLLGQMLPRHVLEGLLMAMSPPVSENSNLYWTSSSPPGEGRKKGVTSGECRQPGEESLGPVVDDNTARNRVHSMAMKHDDITIMFMDIVGFTSMCDEVSPSQVMAYLDSIFHIFDDLSDVYGVFKVETAGDCYIVAGGLIERDTDGLLSLNPGLSPSDGARHVIAFSWAIIQAVRGIIMPNGKPTKIRVGVHTGSVTSGLIGRKLPKFSLFGDTMNTASRMESTSIPLHIQISSSTYRLLASCSNKDSSSIRHHLHVNEVEGAPSIHLPADFLQHFQFRGQMEIKGKGVMDTYIWNCTDPEAAQLMGSHNLIRHSNMVLHNLPSNGIREKSMGSPGTHTTNTCAPFQYPEGPTEAAWL